MSARTVQAIAESNEYTTQTVARITAVKSDYAVVNVNRYAAPFTKRLDRNHSAGGFKLNENTGAEAAVVADYAMRL